MKTTFKQPLKKVGPKQPLKKVGPKQPLKKVGPKQPLKKVGPKSRQNRTAKTKVGFGSTFFKGCLKVV
jgi:hypothetical protein